MELSTEVEHRLDNIWRHLAPGVSDPLRVAEVGNFGEQGEGRREGDEAEESPCTKGPASTGEYRSRLECVALVPGKWRHLCKGAVGAQSASTVVAL